jgi:hypothetical protein
MTISMFFVWVIHFYCQRSPTNTTTKRCAALHCCASFVALCLRLERLSNFFLNIGVGRDFMLRIASRHHISRPIEVTDNFQMNYDCSRFILLRTSRQMWNEKTCSRKSINRANGNILVWKSPTRNRKKNGNSKTRKADNKCWRLMAKQKQKAKRARLGTFCRVTDMTDTNYSWYY